MGNVFTPESFQMVMASLTAINLLIMLYLSWQRLQIKKSEKSIEENHKKALGLYNDIQSITQFKQYQKFKNYDKLSSKNNWYIFGLVNLSLYNKNKKEEDLLNIFDSFEAIGAAWCKRPEDVANDYMMILDGYMEESSKVGKPVLSGGNF